MNVPKIRYDNFTKEWEKVKLSSQASFLQGLTYTPNDVSNDGTIVLRSSNIQNSMVDYNDIVRVNIIIPEKLKIKENDILMCVRNGSKSLVGKTAWLSKNEEKCTWGAFMNIIRPKEKNKFVYYYLNSKYFYNHVWKDLGTATVNQITKQTLESCYLNIPSIEEQEKISNTLSLLDQKIKLQSKKIEDLKLFKKGLDIKIFNNKKLFDVGIIKEYFESDGGTALEKYIDEKGTYNIISIGNYTPDGRYYDNGQKVIYNEKTKMKLLSKNNLAMILNDKTTTGDIIGSTILIDEDNKYIYNQRTQKLICKNINAEYSWCFFNSKYFRDKVFRLSQGGTQIYVNYSQIENQKIFIPKNKKIENDIVKSIFLITKLIDNENDKFLKLQKLKKGLMQNMFV